MRAVVICAICALVSSCADTSSRTPAATLPALPAGPALAPVAAPSSTTSAAEIEAVPPAEATSPRAPALLEGAASLRHFFEALARIDDGTAQDDVHVVHYGDSHTAADFETGPIRRALQARFGNGGRGFVALGNPWKKYVQEGLRNGNTSDWSGERGKLVRGALNGDGMYGLAGASLQTSRRGARAWAEYFARASRIELAYLAQPRGGSLDVYIDGARVGRVSTRAPRAQSGFAPFDVDDGPHRVEVVAAGDGEVRLFGATLDRAQAGLTYDALGINGARIVNALGWNEAHFAEQLRHRAPDLVVLAYGTNESGDDTPNDVYERELQELLGRVSRAAPAAACLLLGPPDRAIKTNDGWVTSPKLLEIIATQKRVARAAGCAFFDQLAAMGGPGTIAAWAEEANRRAGHDHVHFTREAYAQLGGAFAASLLQAYADFRAEAGLAPVGPPPQPFVIPPPAPAVPPSDPSKVAAASR